MFKFILKLLLFFLPVSVIFWFPLYVYWQARESTPVGTVVVAQSGKQQVLLGLAYSTITKSYKEALVADRNPAIITLGASRVLQFRSSFFASSTSFVNAGSVVAVISVSGVDEYTAFIKQIPAKNSLAVILVSLDPWMYTRDQSPNINWEPVSPVDRVGTFLGGRWRTVYQNYMDHRFTIPELHEARQKFPAIGLTALIDQVGFLDDGSFFSGALTSDPNHASIIETEIKEKSAAIENNRTDVELEFGTSISSANIESLRKFLALCKERNIYVIGFIPPFPHPVYQALVSVPDAHTRTAQELPIVLRKTMSEFQFPFFDYTDAQQAGIKDAEFRDIAHTGDKGSLRMLIDMASKNPVLARYVSLPGLRSLLLSTKGDFIITHVPASQTDDGR